MKNWKYISGAEVGNAILPIEDSMLKGVKDNDIKNVVYTVESPHNPIKKFTSREDAKRYAQSLVEKGEFGVHGMKEFDLNGYRYKIDVNLNAPRAVNNSKVGNGIKEDMKRAHPSDSIVDDVKASATYEAIVKQPWRVYDILGVGDSEIREYAFELIAKKYGVDYDTIYYAWLHSGYKLSDHKGPSNQEKAKRDFQKLGVSVSNTKTGNSKVGNGINWDENLVGKTVWVKDKGQEWRVYVLQDKGDKIYVRFPKDESQGWVSKTRVTSKAKPYETANSTEKLFYGLKDDAEKEEKKSDEAIDELKKTENRIIEKESEMGQELKNLLKKAPEWIKEKIQFAFSHGFTIDEKDYINAIKKEVGNSRTGNKAGNSTYTEADRKRLYELARKHNKTAQEWAEFDELNRKEEKASEELIKRIGKNKTSNYKTGTSKLKPGDKVESYGVKGVVKSIKGENEDNIYGEPLIEVEFNSGVKKVVPEHYLIKVGNSAYEDGAKKGKEDKRKGKLITAAGFEMHAPGYTNLSFKEKEEYRKGYFSTNDLTKDDVYKWGNSKVGNKGLWNASRTIYGKWNEKDSRPDDEYARLTWLGEGKGGLVNIWKGQSMTSEKFGSTDRKELERWAERRIGNTMDRYYTEYKKNYAMAGFGYWVVKDAKDPHKSLGMFNDGEKSKAEKLAKDLNEKGESNLARARKAMNKDDDKEGVLDDYGRLPF